MNRLLVVAAFLACAPPPVDPPPPAQLPATTSPRWAFRPWISKDISTGDDMRAFIEGFQTRDIPVGVAVLDSPWETNYNTFIVNDQRYPDFPRFVQDLHDDDIRLVLWVTQMVNEESYDLEPGGDVYDGEASNYRDAARNGFFVNDGELNFWWKGQGAAVDFFNDDAVLWWRGEQDKMLDLGVDGWKLDFGEQYIETIPIQTAQGAKTLQEYSEAYYRDFWEHGVTKEGVDEFVTMVRPYDASYGFEGRFYARREHSPVNWVGDQRRDWEGLVDGLDHIFRSAAAGYVMLGSDIGGYLNTEGAGDIPFDAETLNRWIAYSAFTPLFQLHGRANLEPWNVPDEPVATTDNYRYWATLHDQMVPFQYSLSREAWKGDGGVLHPLGDEAAWVGDWRFVLGDAFLIAPLFEAGASRDVVLPDDARWYDWWDLAADAHEGGTTVAFTAPSLREIGVLVKEGAIVPLRVANDVTGFGSSSSADADTVLVFPSSTETTFTTFDDDGATTTYEAEGDTIRASRAARDLILRVRADAASGATGLTTRASRDEVLELGGFFFDAAAKAAWIRVSASASPVEVTLE